MGLAVDKIMVIIRILVDNSLVTNIKLCLKFVSLKRLCTDYMLIYINVGPIISHF